MGNTDGSLNLYEISDILHRVSMITLNSYGNRDYGTGEQYTSTEVHLVSYIANHPNCTAVEIAREWGRTRSAVSQMIKKLRNNGLIIESSDDNHGKKVLLRLTPKGKMLDAAHCHIDMQYWSDMIGELENHFSDEEISTTFKLLKKWCELNVSMIERKK